MSENSSIEWCHHTVNFWWGCRKVSDGCKFCYAERLSERFKKDCWGDSPRLFRVEKAVKECLAINRKAAKAGRRDIVFVNSMSDFFEPGIKMIAARNEAFETFAQCHNLTFL
ncbi:hypothetical protein LCGC14_2862850, partial [marine sediment metagenome]